MIKLKDLDPIKFQRLCNELCKIEHANIKSIEGSGGDKGIDAYIGNLSDDSPLHIFQYKFLPATLGDSGKKQIKKSIITVNNNFKNLKRYTLILPKDLTIKETEWFENLKKEYPSIEFNILDETYIINKLNTYLQIRQQYFPLSIEEIKKITDHTNFFLQNLNFLIKDYSLLFETEVDPHFNRCLGLRKNQYQKISDLTLYSNFLIHLETGYKEIKYMLDSLIQDIDSFNILYDDKLIQLMNIIVLTFKKNYPKNRKLDDFDPNLELATYYYINTLRTFITLALQLKKSGVTIKETDIKLNSTINDCINISYSNGILITICKDLKSDIKEFLNTIYRIVQEMEINYNNYHNCKKNLIFLVENFKMNLNQIKDELTYGGFLNGSCNICKSFL